MDYRDLSFVQYRILSAFIRKPQLTYSEARPEDIDNDLYKYHLKFLQEKGVVSKTDTWYSLTDDGKKLVQYLDISGTARETFKISVLCYLFHGGNVLLQKRARQPYLGDIEVISGKLLPGEAVEAAAARKLLEETGLSARFSLSGIIRKIRRFPVEQIFEDTLYHVCRAQDPTGTLEPANGFGEHFWTPVTQALQLISKNTTFTPNSHQVMRCAASGEETLFYLTEDISLPRV